MSAGKVIVFVLAIACLVIAAIYIAAPETIGGPTAAGKLMPQQGYGLAMPGSEVTYQFTTIPLGVGSLTVPQWSAIVIFAILGVMFLIIGLGPSRKAGAE